MLFLFFLILFNVTIGGVITGKVIYENKKENKPTISKINTDTKGVKVNSNKTAPKKQEPAPTDKSKQKNTTDKKQTDKKSSLKKFEK